MKEESQFYHNKKWWQFWRKDNLEEKAMKIMPKESPKELKKEIDGTIVPPGRVSVDNDLGFTSASVLRGLNKMVEPSFRTELIETIRALYKINPDVSIAVQDMMKLSNTGHRVYFDDNTPKEAKAMLDHLDKTQAKWSNYTAGIDGLVNKMFVQSFIGGAIAVEGPPNENLDGIDTVLFINPEDIKFKRERNGIYHPYQKNKYRVGNQVNEPYIRLNLSTFKYVGTYNDTDEPYGIPPFMAALDSLKTDSDMMINFKQIMELMGLIGFLEVKIEKPLQRANESEDGYKRKLHGLLRELKVNMREGLKDGLVVGFNEDHEFQMHSTTTNLNNVEKPYTMNRRKLANGLGVSGNILGVSESTTEGGASISLSKLISQLKNSQMMVGEVLKFLYRLDLILAGYNPKKIRIVFNNSTVTDDVKHQQSQEYKIRNQRQLWTDGIINQDEYAWNMGYARPSMRQDPPPMEDNEGKTPDDSAAKRKREADKDTSDRRGREKSKETPKRKDGSTKPT